MKKPPSVPRIAPGRIKDWPGYIKLPLPISGFANRKAAMVVPQRSAILRRVSPLTTITPVSHAAAANAGVLDANVTTNTAIRIIELKNFFVRSEERRVGEEGIARGERDRGNEGGR